VTRYDMARASVLAIEAVRKGTLPNKHETFLLTNSTEFTPDEVPELRANPEAVFERHYPGILELYKQYEITLRESRHEANSSKSTTSPRPRGCSAGSQRTPYEHSTKI